MTITRKILAGVSLTALVLAPMPALAQATPPNGTTAGTTITNEVSVAYQVGGVQQTAVTDTDEFTVDRRVNLVVAQEGNTTTSVDAGQADAVTTFTVTNTTNAVMDFRLAASNRVGGTSANGGTDTIQVTNLRIFRDSNDDGVLDSADEEVTYLDEIGANDTVRVFIVADIPDASAAPGAVAGVRLTATAREGGTADEEGLAVTQSDDPNTAGVDTVFGDTNANGNIARDGISFAEDDYTIRDANLGVVKISRVVSDPFNDVTNPKAIPGAVVEYCIVVTNPVGSATATSVTVTDEVPASMDFDTSFDPVIGGTSVNLVTSTCDPADGTADANAYDSGTRIVTGDLGTVSPGATETVIFRATIR